MQNNETTQRRCSVIAAAALIATVSMAHADGLNQTPAELANLMRLGVKELMDLTVTSVSKKEERLVETTAAVYVITGEDIRRSGVTSIPEALRMVPGLQVARVNSNTWAISSRGFNLRYSNKLLVLMDGRTLYTPMFSGVLWNTKDTMLEDVERIEVIRGPGAALWGANAVNGVINIITRKATDTQGVLLSASAGSEERGFGALRYGGKMGEEVSFRGYMKYFNRDDFVLSSGEIPSNDQWDSLQGGFRVDGKMGAKSSFTLQGDMYSGGSGDVEDITFPFPPYLERRDVDTEFKGGNILGRWTREFSDASNMQLQLYYDHAEDLSHFLEGQKTIVRTYDLDFQHRLPLGDSQNFTYGLGFRHISDDINSVVNISYYPNHRTTQSYSAFVHDEITLIRDRLKVILGSRFEHNNYSGFEVQPNGHILWTPHKDHTVWAAVSRAVRTPTRIESDLKATYFEPLPPDSLYFGSPLALSLLQGNNRYDSEDVLAYEIGYRVQPTKDISLDIASFYNVYHNLRTYEIGEPFLETTDLSSHLSIPITLGNKMGGEAHGVELSSQWQALPWWRLQAVYAYLRLKTYGKEDTTDPYLHYLEGLSPRHQFSLRSSQDLPLNLELDIFLRHVGNLPERVVGSYTEMDIRLGWNPMKNLELSLVGQNLLSASHSEFKDETFLIQATEVQRGVYGKVAWRF